MSTTLEDEVTRMCDVELELHDARRRVLKYLLEMKHEKYFKVDWAGLRKAYDRGRDS